MDNPETLATLDTQNTGAIKNGQPRDTGNIRYTRHRMKTKNAILETKTMGNMDTTQKPGMNPGAQNGQSVTASYKTPAM